MNRVAYGQGHYSGGIGYLKAELCTGATHMINPGYKGGTPNNLLPWQYKHTYLTNIW